MCSRVGAFLSAGKVGVVAISLCLQKKFHSVAIFYGEREREKKNLTILETHTYFLRLLKFAERFLRATQLKQQS